MKKILLLAMMCLAPFGYANAQQESMNTVNTDFSVGLHSDYFFRGVSQMQSGAHWNMGGQVEAAGFFGGAWVGAVDFGDEASYEYDLWAGYKLDVMDNMSVSVGAIQYRYDAGPYDMVEEVFVGLDFGMLSIMGYQDTETDDNYAEMTLDVSRFVPVVDMNLHYGYHDDGNDFSALRVSKDINDNLNFGVTVMLETVMDGQSMDSISAGFNYVF